MTLCGIADRKIGRVRMFAAWLTISIGWTQAGLTNPISAAEEPDPVAASKTDSAAVLDSQAVAFFEKQVRPILANHCYKCHGASEPKGGLRLDSRAAVLRGGDTGPAIIVGKPDESLLVDAVRYGETYQMPPKGKLAENEIEALIRWVAAGAPWPDENPEATQVSSTAAVPAPNSNEPFWAFEAVADVPVPSVKDQTWGATPIDCFILAALEEVGLGPAPHADKRTLLRRATFDLTGLPPSTAEVDAFLADDTADAFAHVVDRLLASPRYGERWGRHWLDVARYADSNGMDENLAFSNAFRYRDYVIDAFNRDLPYSEFVRQQLAGDLLPAASEDVRLRQLTATGFLVIGPKMLAEDDPVKMEMDIIDEQVDTIGQAFLGMTLGCARCHDHKFDPISMADYYGLAGILKSTKTMENFKVVARWQERPLATDALLARIAEQRTGITEQQQQVASIVADANRALVEEARQHVAEYLLAEHEVRSSQQLMTALRSPTPDEGRSSGAIVIEAEKFVRGNVVVDFSLYGSTIGVIYNKGELPNYTEYEIELPSTEACQIELRYAAAEPRPCRLSVNGQVLAENIAGQATGSWLPDGQRWETVGVHVLAQGKNTLRLERDGPFPHFDRISVVPRALSAGQTPARLVSVQQAASNRNLNAGVLAKLSGYFEQQKPHPLWTAWRATSGSTDSNEAIIQTQPRSLPELAKWYQTALAGIDLTNRVLAAQANQFAGWLPLTALPLVSGALAHAFEPIGLPDEPEKYYPTDVQSQLAERRAAITRDESAISTIPDAMAVSDREPENLRIHIRGSHWTLGDQVPRRFPAVLDRTAPTTITADRSGRLELAQWLTSPKHPLTSRVMVNRIWQWHFGEGIVRSPDNFGRLGEPPSNQPLLDWLARQFMESGWSIKAMHRLLMLSNAYQMSGQYDATAALRDPENRLGWRANRRRMDVEELRDAVLAISGQLDTTMGGSLLNTANRAYVAGTSSVNPTNYDSPRRAVYLPVIRSAVYDMFQAFDFADPSVLMGRRNGTTVAPQSLFMLNSPFILAATRRIADELTATDQATDADRIRIVYERFYNRPPSIAERDRAQEFLAQAKRQWQAAGDAQSPIRAWQSLCQALLAANEFIYIE